MTQRWVDPKERTLSKVTLVLGLLVWLVLIVGTFGGALIGLLVGYILYLFMHSALIAYVRGNGVELSARQWPDLHSQFAECCQRLQIETPPQAYVLNGSGNLNAFATRFLGTSYVVLLSDTIDAMAQHPDGVRFYIGHELGHLRMKHLQGHFWRWPALWLPLLGAAYSRAQERTCDRHGLACSGSPEQAALALSALSTGPQRWQDLSLDAYLAQNRYTAGFWMSFHGIIAAYPWLTQRAAHLLGREGELPRRNTFAYLPALFLPHAGRLGAGFGLIILIYIVFIAVSVAIPIASSRSAQAKLETAYAQSETARDHLAAYYARTQSVPASLDAAGIADELPGGAHLNLNSENMVLSVAVGKSEMLFVPSLADDGAITWECVAGKETPPKHLPAACGTK